jgi:uncharacterized cupin superfamily protein
VPFVESPPEAKLEQTDDGVAVTSEGWFVLNVADVRWLRHDVGGQWTDFEGRGSFADYGIGIHVVQPGQPNGKYHSESVQEDFLVLSGECICVIEGEERHLKAWDFVHCPAGTKHIFVGAGDEPCAILMVGTRSRDKVLHYPLDEVAAKHGASTPEETNVPKVAYSDWAGDYEPTRGDWPPST